MLKLVQTFEEPQPGGYSGTPTREFRWKIIGQPQTDSRGRYVRVGSWAANFWCHVAVGKTDKQTLGNLRRRLSAYLRRSSVKCTFSYREE